MRFFSWELTKIAEIIDHMLVKLTLGANSTIVIYNAKSSLARFENKQYFLLLW
jgi:hypothetical protein